jgi:Flp pilus assembly pilin Flp
MPKLIAPTPPGVGGAARPTVDRPTAHRFVGRARARLRGLADERGAATAEYAVATMAAVGFAGLLVVLLRGDEVRGILTELVRNALTVG